VDSTEIAIAAARAASDKKAEDIIVIGVSELLVVTDYFVICTGRNDRQVRTIADEIEDQLREKCGVKPAGREGVEQGTWVLLDFVDVVVHVFQPAEREFYRLEKLWSDAPRLELPEDVTGPAEPRWANTDDVVEAHEAE
jgi:ribosome-associated protein